MVIAIAVLVFLAAYVAYAAGRVTERKLWTSTLQATAISGRCIPASLMSTDPRTQDALAEAYAGAYEKAVLDIQSRVLERIA